MKKQTLLEYGPFDSLPRKKILIPGFDETESYAIANYYRAVLIGGSYQNVYPGDMRYKSFIYTGKGNPCLLNNLN